MWRWANEEDDYLWYAAAVFFVIVTIVAVILGRDWVLVACASLGFVVRSVYGLAR